jgi:hypothetical protein
MNTYSIQKESKTMYLDAVNLHVLNKYVKKAKYIFVYAPSLEEYVEVKKTSILNLIKHKYLNLNIDPIRDDIASLKIEDDELLIDTVIQ